MLFILMIVVDILIMYFDNKFLKVWFFEFFFVLYLISFLLLI